MKQKTLTNNLKETRIEEKQFQTQAISQFDIQPKEHYPQNTIFARMYNPTQLKKNQKCRKPTDYGIIL